MEVFEIIDEQTGRTSLHEAVENNNLTAVKEIVESLADDDQRTEKLNRKDASGDSAFSWAAKPERIDPVITPQNIDHAMIPRLVPEARKDILAYMLTLPEIDINSINNRGESPLIEAVRIKNVAGVKLLIEDRRLDVNYQNPEDYNRHSLFYTLSTEILSLLVSHPKINVNAKDSAGQSVISNMVYTMFEFDAPNQLAFIKDLIENKHMAISTNDKSVLLYRAASFGDVDLVKFALADPKVETNYKDSLGQTGLYVACSRRPNDVVELLLSDPRVDPNLATSNGYTPLKIACKVRNIQVIELLLKDPRLRDVNLEHKDPITQDIVPLETEHRTKIINKMLDQKYDIQNLSSFHINAFKLAVQHKHHQILVDFASQYLAALATVAKNNTALKAKKAKVDKTLLAKAHKTDGTGKNILHLAAEHGHEATVKKLLNHLSISDIKRPDNDGLTPRSLALLSGHDHIVQLIESYTNSHKKGVLNRVRDFLQSKSQQPSSSSDPRGVHSNQGSSSSQSSATPDDLYQGFGTSLASPRLVSGKTSAKTENTSSQKETSKSKKGKEKAAKPRF